MVYDENTHSLYFAVTAEGKIYVYDIAAANTYTIDEVTPLTSKIGFSNKYGKFYFPLNSYNSTTALAIHSVDTEQPVADNAITLNVRDFEGVEDGLAPDTRPSSITGTHEYNLRNQGWPLHYKCVENPGDADDEDGAGDIDPVGFTKTDIGVYPSNADQIQLGKAENVARAKRINYYSPKGLETNILGNTHAPKGHFIYDAFNTDRSNGKTILSSLGATYDTSTNERPTTVAFYAGRAFYSGVNDNEYNDKIYFSQILENMEFVGKCYQEADPTSEHISDLIDTDGGVIKIIDAKQITLLKAVEDSLIVGASNGVWEISGGSGGFSATDYSIRKISSNGLRNPYSAVDAEGTFLYWSDGGIYAIVPDENTGDLRAENITVETIQTFYNDISAEGKDSVVGFYDNKNKVVIWLYKDSSETYMVLNKSLRYDPVLKAFYPFSFEESATLPRILDIDSYLLGTTTGQTFNVVDGSGDTVTSDSEANDVVITTEGIAKDIEQSLHYFTIWPDGTDWDYTYSDLTDTAFKDWADAGTNNYYDAYVETGHKVKGDAIRPKQAPVVGVVCERTETNWSFADDGEEYINPSSCQMTTKWDFYENTASNKWNGPHQTYRFRRYVAPDSGATFDNFYPDVVVTKNKVRGRGKALKIRFAADDGKDLKLLGWQIFWSGNTNP